MCLSLYTKCWPGLKLQLFPYYLPHTCFFFKKKQIAIFRNFLQSLTLPQHSSVGRCRYILTLLCSNVYTIWCVPGLRDHVNLSFHRTILVCFHQCLTCFNKCNKLFVNNIGYTSRTFKQRLSTVRYTALYGAVELNRNYGTEYTQYRNTVYIFRIISKSSLTYFINVIKTYQKFVVAETRSCKSLNVSGLWRSTAATVRKVFIYRGLQYLNFEFRRDIDQTQYLWSRRNQLMLIIQFCLQTISAITTYLSTKTSTDDGNSRCTSK